MTRASLAPRLLPVLLPLGLLAVPPVVEVVRSWSEVQRPPRPAITFDVEADGAPAVPDVEWPIAFEPGHEASLSGGAAVCDDQAFLLDHRRKQVHRVSLSAGAAIDRIGDPSGGTFAYPYAIAAACRANKLFVADYAGLFVINLATGAIETRFPKPPTFATSLGRLAVDASARRVFVPGVWARRPNDWLFNGLHRMFVDDWLGREIDVVTGETSPFVPPIERGCFTASPLCLSVSLDRVAAGGEVAWIVAQKISTRVGLFDAHRRAVRLVDVRSPRFREDGQSVPRQRTLVEKIAWHEHNSVIEAVVAFRDGFAVVHSVHRTKGWQPGGQVDFEVFVNIFGYDGRPLVSDVRLPDLPVAHDADSLYTVSYGPAGRQVTSHRRLVVARFPIWSLMVGGAPVARPVPR